jgi:hypothetical protein
VAYDEELATRIRELVGDQSDELVATTPARPMEMRGREMAGWLRVDSDDVRRESELARWVALGTTYARSLPPKS